MKVIINGEPREIPEGLSVAALLGHLSMESGRVAIERNRGILPRTEWEETRIQPGDTFEIVQLVGGG
ncbi:MAG: sulfur carrier protein ThiS [Candidatus Acidiferrales bacterium]